MQTSKRIFEDLAKVASGAASTLAGVREEVEALVRQRMERLLAEMDVVPRDEFDAVKAMAAAARTEQEKQAKRLDRLEAKLGVKAAAKPRAKAKTAPRKPAARKPAAKARTTARKRPAGGK